MDARSILQLPIAHRRTFIAFLIALCAVIVLCDIFLFPPDSRLSGYAQALASAVIVSLIMYWIVISFIPSQQNTQTLQQVEPKDITAEFEALLSEATRWRYTGNFGRYLRGKVLPTLAIKPNMQISVSIIDPQDELLCNSHAEYRNKINSIDKGRHFDATIVALEVIVTIIHCAWYVTNKNVSIELFLLSMFDPLRIDSSDSAMILTVEDRRRPALKITNEHFMYNHFDLQMRFERQQGRELPLQKFSHCTSISAITEADVREFLTSINMQDLCEKLTPGKIAEACREVRNPYED
ncbi:MAG: hypothetical protein F4X83_06770 [Chloroflexi bacterium]|nr:hypothetical protein [Chloroflexota bacterium]